MRDGLDVDPTKNVLDLVTASVSRLDDLATERQLRTDEAIAHLKEMADVRAAHAAELRLAESERIDANRRTDVEASRTAASEAEARAQVLAAQVVATAEPLRAAIEDLRRSQYEAVGIKSQTTEARLTTGSVVAIVSVATAILFGVSGIVIALILSST
jgi:hypothetical protein